MFFKPQWYKILPDRLKPKKDTILESIESFRKKYDLPHEMISMGIITTPWAVKMVQEDCLRQGRILMPNASEKELWKGVLLSRLHTKLESLDIPVGDWVNPLSEEEILSLIENIDAICVDLKSWRDVVEFIISIERHEGTFSDPSGILDELNVLLESETEQSINDEECSENIDDDIDKAPSRYFLESRLATLIDNISADMFSDPLACILMYRDYRFACAVKDKSDRDPFSDTVIGEVYFTEVDDDLYETLKEFKENGISSDDIGVSLTTDMFAKEAVEILLERSCRIKK